MARHDVARYVGLYHAPPPPLPEDVLEWASRGERRPRRFHWTVDDSPGRQRPDIPFSFGGELILSPRASEALLPLIEPWVWLERDVEIDGARGYVAAVLTQQYDCLDEQRSTGTRGASSGAWIEVHRLVLREQAIGPVPIFRIPTRTLQWRPMLAESLAQAIATHGLTGLTLQEAEMAPGAA
jgi:hypothetical protein